MLTLKTTEQLLFASDTVGVADMIARMTRDEKIQGKPLDSPSKLSLYTVHCSSIKHTIASLSVCLLCATDTTLAFLITYRDDD